MTKLIVDDKEIDVPAEYTLLQACEAAGAEIPPGRASRVPGGGCPDGATAAR